MTTDTQRPSDKIAALGNQLSAAAVDGPGLTMTIEQVCGLVTLLTERAAEVRKLERMLERRLRAADIPWRREQPATAANEPGSNLIQFVPRRDARIVPFQGGAA